MGQNNDFSQKELLPPPELIHYVGGGFPKSRRRIFEILY